MESCSLCEHFKHTDARCQADNCNCSLLVIDEAREGNLGEVIDGRTSVYGEVIPAFTRQAQAISAVLDHEVQPWEVPLIMIAIKMIRTTEAPDYSDNSDDIEGYLDIFRQLMGEDMVHARSVKEYVAERTRRSHF